MQKINPSAHALRELPYSLSCCMYSKRNEVQTEGRVLVRISVSSGSDREDILCPYLALPALRLLSHTALRVLFCVWRR